MSKRRVVITGSGLATSMGFNVEEVFKDLCNGKSGVKTITKFDTTDYPTKIGGEISGWTGSDLIEKRANKKLDPFAQFGVHAAILAVNDSGLDFEKEDRWRCGSIVGSGVGGMEEFAVGHARLEAKGPERISPFMVPKLMCNSSAANISIHYKLRGPNTAVVTACASGGHAIGDAFNHIRYGTADIIIAGGAEAALTKMGTACFIAIKALSRRNDAPELASRPFDRDRDGFILSEGAGIVVLEEYEHAKARGAKIYAEVVGYGQSADGGHITAPHPEGVGAAHAMKMAIQDAQINNEQISYINAHGTSTGLGDLAETKAVKSLFQDHAYKLMMSSTKSMTGHLLGASGGVEAIIAAMALKTGIAPPTINLDNPDEGCDLDYVANTAKEKDMQYVMSNSFGFGGHNVSLVLKKI